jgi:hypothetical protein
MLFELPSEPYYKLEDLQEAKKEPKGLAADMSRSISRLNMQMANWAMTLQASYESPRNPRLTQRSTRSALRPSSHWWQRVRPRRRTCSSGRRNQSARAVRRRSLKNTRRKSTHPPRPPLPNRGRDRALPLLRGGTKKGKRLLRCRKNIHNELSP